jgi:C4-dicarboxylate-specific signal transduction histidine kinase
LQNELSRAARLTAASQMAAALAHEISQPLTAVVNSVNAAKRLLARGGPANFLTAQEITDEAAGQALRASEMVRGIRNQADAEVERASGRCGMNRRLRALSRSPLRSEA